MEDYLRANHFEPMPAWLAEAENQAGDVRSLCQNLLSSRLVFYPGAGIDGDPVAVFNRSQAAHCFVYVDYGMTRDRLEAELEAGFHGYESLLRIEVKEPDLVTDWVRHHVPSAGSGPPFPPVSPYGFIEIFVRQAGFDDAHGAERFAVLFLAADGYAAFDALFCQGNGVPPPFCIVLQDHGYGGNYDRFGGGGLLENLTTKADVRPALLLVGEKTAPWNGYQRCDADPVNMGQHLYPRSLYAAAFPGLV